MSGKYALLWYSELLPVSGLFVQEGDANEWRRA